MVERVYSYLIFYGTLTTVVKAADEDAAFEAFLGRAEPRGDDHWDRTWDGAKWIPMGEYRRALFGRVVPPVREEVTIRRPKESDRGWIEESADPSFLALLPELVDA